MGKITRHLTSRRDLLRSLSAWAAAAFVPSFSTSATANVSGVPFKVIETTLGEAQRMQRELRSANTYPLIVGSGDRLDRLIESTEPLPGEPRETVDTIIQKADRLTHPRDLSRLRAEDSKETCKETMEILNDPNAKLPKMTEMEGDGRIRELPEREVRNRIMLMGCGSSQIEAPEAWPEETIAPETVQTLLPILFTPDFIDKGSILEVPTDDWTTVPAHLFWGGWNANPDPEYHIAAWRSWRDRYGAYLIGLTSDALIFSVDRRPGDRSEAFMLAKELYEYCPDIVDQGMGTITNLAALLMVSNAWFFWWD